MYSLSLITSMLFGTREEYPRRAKTKTFQFMCITLYCVKVCITNKWYSIILECEGF